MYCECIWFVLNSEYTPENCSERNVLQFMIDTLHSSFTQCTLLFALLCAQN